MNKTQILACILFVLMILILGVESSNHHGSDIPQMQISFHTLATGIGVFISGGAALAMFLNCIGGSSLEQLSPWLFPMFSGLLLLNVHWTLSISLGLIAFTFVIRSQ